MLFTSTLSVNYSFAEPEDNHKENKAKIPKNTQKDRLWAILTEKVVNGKLEVQRYALPVDLSEEDLHRMVSFEGKTTGWAYVNYKAYHSGIVLFDGKASKIGENLWNISTKGIQNLGEMNYDLKLSGKSNDSDVIMSETVSDEDISFKIIFTGKLAETNQEDALSISITIFALKNSMIDQNINHVQTVGFNSNSNESGNSNQELINSISGM